MLNWNDKTGIRDACEHATVLINLAGKSVNCRFTEKNRKAILDTRLETTRQLGQIIQECNHPPALWLNASTASVYKEPSGSPMTEKDLADRNSFLADVARQWEKTCLSFQLPATRQSVMRFGMVLGSNGGALQPLARLTRLGLGGRQGNGRQMISWVHVEDLFQIILFLIQRSSEEKIFNCTAPTPVNNQTFMKTLREIMRVPFGIPANEWMVRTGAFFIGTEPELILEDLWVMPQRLLEMGYVFKYPQLRSALEDCLT